MVSDEDIARRVLQNHRNEIEKISSRLPSLIARLRQIDREAWRREGRDLVSWMNREADDMAKAERDVAITKVTGGSAAIAGGLMTGAGIVASFFTFGLAAPLAVAGVALGGAGAAASAGGDIAQLSILHMKTCEIKERCETFGQKTEGVLSILLEMAKLMTELSKLCQQNDSVNVGTGVIEIVLKSGKSAVNLVKAGLSTRKIATVVYQITQLQRSSVIFGADFLKLVVGSVTGSGLTISRALFKGAGAAVGIGFGIWDVVDASGTLQNGGSHAALIRDNASQVDNTVREIDSALRILDL